MVVVPTENQVTLSFGRSSAEWLGILATLVGLALVGYLMVLDHRRRVIGVPGVGSDADPASLAAPGQLVDADQPTDVGPSPDSERPADIEQPPDLR